MSSIDNDKSCHAQPEKPAVDADWTLAGVRERLSGLSGRSYWRGLDEIAETAGFREFLHREFPRQASEWTDDVSRRNFLKVMGASLALAGLSGCVRNPTEKIVPFVKSPENLVPGKPLYYATALTRRGVATGVLVESHMGRPTKIEGNDLHPASLGGTTASMQASILSLYDPDRSQVMRHLGEVRPWESFLSAVRDAMTAQKAQGGKGLRILSESITSPTLTRQIEALLAEYPAARWHRYEPIHDDSAREGVRMALGRDADVRNDLAKAQVIVSLDADILFDGPAAPRSIRDFAAGRKVAGGGHDHAAAMNRLYVIESGFSPTGAKADHRLAVAPSDVDVLARALAGQVGVPGVTADAGAHKGWIDAVARDLRGHAARSVVIAGESQPPAVHALALAINNTLGNIGTTVIVTEPVESDPVSKTDSLRDLVRDMNAGGVEMLMILGGNPVYNAPADLGFAAALDKVGLRFHHGPYIDETSELCHWHIPEAHPLETWSDARAFDGTVTLIQPLIAPLYEGKSAHEIVAALAGRSDRTGFDLVRETWKERSGALDFEKWWRKALHDGIVENTELPPLAVGAVNLSGLPPASAPADGITLLFRADPCVYDGRDANNGWLQELPKPLTRLTWDNAALVSPRLAERNGYRDGDVVTISVPGGATVQAPVWILPGQAENVITLPLGYGRTRSGRVGDDAGFNAYALRTGDHPWWVGGATLAKAGRRMKLACTQLHHSMEGRDLIRTATLEEHTRNPHWTHETGAHEPGPDMTMYPPYKYEGHAWGMTVDLTSCVGCNACVTACQAENNIPVVGKDQVQNGREMHWMRIDRYFGGSLDLPEVHHQPVMCQHCENAPCEVVCPVEATVHNHEGLNDMVYNRCVGTRYCANNCPYKVRRFNFLQYSDQNTPSLKLLNNPDVTVRTRGVMEKCSYCVQRINHARIEAHKDDREIRDGEVTTACQQACPARAITFGDINDKGSAVAKLKADALNYGILTDLNTHPRTTYLAELRNPNPEIEALKA